MKIAFVRPPATYADWYRQPHFSLASLAAVVEAEGFQCKIFDAYYNAWSLDKLVSEIQHYEPTVLGISAMTHEIVLANEIACEVKGKIHCVSVVGGCHVTALPERTLVEFPSFDFGIFGEGETTLLDLLTHIQQSHTDREFAHIKGLVYRDMDHVRTNADQVPLTSKELDALPFPAYHHYYSDNHRALAHPDGEYRIMATRGCPYRCAFCMQVLGRQLRRRSPEGIVDEIHYAMRTYGAHTFRFQDEVLVSDNRYSHQLFDLMIKSGLSRKIRWSGQTRVNLVTDSIIGLAKEAGCYLLGMGIESGDDDTLLRIHKGFTVQQVRKAVQIIKKHQISLGTYFIIGHPDETWNTAQKTINLAAELNTDTIAVGLMVPYPGTEIYEMAKKGEGGYQLLSEDWSTYDKYGNKALALDTLSLKALDKLQRKAYLKFYVKNLRLLDLWRFVWEKRRAMYHLFLRPAALFKSARKDESPPVSSRVSHGN